MRSIVDSFLLWDYFAFHFTLGSEEYIQDVYSKAFNAHPLEIFFVALSAGFIGGLMWRIIAMPVYTIIRIIFSELLINLTKS